MVSPPPGQVNIDNSKQYDFGVWDLHGQLYNRWSINFFAAWGHEIIAARPFPEDDEQHLSADYPKQIKKRNHPWKRIECRLCGCRECNGSTFGVLLASGDVELYRCFRSISITCHRQGWIGFTCL